MSSGWSFYVIALTVIMFVGVIWVLLGNRTRPSNQERTTGHSHDGIEEYDNPLPAWWFYMFIITIVFSIGYLIVFPGMGNFAGLLDWTSEKKLERELAQAQQRYAPVFARYREVPVEQLYKEPKAMKMAQRIFANNCAQCHGSDARGSTGFPNLADNDWLYGGSPEQIAQSINAGRTAAMPAWGAILSEAASDAVVTYIASLSANDSVAAPDSSTVFPADHALGVKTYNSYCVACHGAEGKGNAALGAPDLTNGIWLYGGSVTELAHSVRNGRNGIMPAHEGVLTADKRHLLTAYVYGLSRQPQDEVSAAIDISNGGRKNSANAVDKAIASTIRSVK